MSVRWNAPQHESYDPLVSAYVDGLVCWVCMKPTTQFFIVTGHPDFYLKILMELGVPPRTALALTVRDRDKVMRRAPVCMECSVNKGFDTPSDEAALRLIAGGDTEAPVPVKILADSPASMEKLMKFIAKQHAEREKETQKEEQKMARLKGFQKDMQDIVEELKAKHYFVKTSGGHALVYEREGGAYITTISGTPTNAKQTRANVLAKVKRWERANLPAEAEPKEPAVVAVTEPKNGGARQYRMRSLPEKAAIVSRYDDCATKEDQRKLLAKEETRHDQIRQWRQQLQEAGWHIPGEAVPLPDEPERSKMCTSCAKDKALTDENWTQFKKDGRYVRYEKCNTCLDDEMPNIAAAVSQTNVAGKPVDKPMPPMASSVVPPVTFSAQPVQVRKDGTVVSGHARAAAAEQAGIPLKTEETENDDPLSQDKIARMVSLYGRKLEIETRQKELDREKEKLTAELNEISTKLLEIIS